MIPRDAVLEAGDALLPIAGEGDGPIFNEAWEAEAFAIVVALHEAKLFTWSEWTATLGREIAARVRVGRSRRGRFLLSPLARGAGADRRRQRRRQPRCSGVAQGGLGARGRIHSARAPDPARQRSAIGRLALALAERQAPCHTDSG